MCKKWPVRLISVLSVTIVVDIYKSLMIDIQVVIVTIEYNIYSLCRLRRAFRNQNTCFILIFSQVYDHMAVLETWCQE